jgi:hypothetical protein
MHKIFSLYLYVYGPIYRLRGRCQPELSFQLLLDIGVPSESDLDLDSLSDLDYNSFPNHFVVQL